MLVDVEHIDEFNGTIFDAVEGAEALVQTDGSLSGAGARQGLVVVAPGFCERLRDRARLRA